MAGGQVPVEANSPSTTGGSKNEPLRIDGLIISRGVEEFKLNSLCAAGTESCSCILKLSLNNFTKVAIMSLCSLVMLTVV